MPLQPRPNMNAHLVPRLEQLRRGARDGAWPLVDGRGGRPRRRLAARRRPRRGARDGAWPLVDGRGGRPRRRSHRCPPLVRDIAYDGAVGVITHGPVCGRCVRRWPLSRASPRAARHSAARHSAARHSAARGGGWGKRPVSLLKRRAARRLSQIARDWAAARGDAHISSCRTRHRRALR